MIQNEEEAEGEISSFAALCTALSATIGTGNIVGVATAVCAGGPGALFWMVAAAFLGMATKYSEGLLAVKYRIVAPDGHSLGGPFYYIEQGMGKNWKWLAKLFAFSASVSDFSVSELSARSTVSQVRSTVSLIRQCTLRQDPSFPRRIFLVSRDRIPDPDGLCRSRIDRRCKTDRKCEPDRCTFYGDPLFCFCHYPDHLQYYWKFLQLLK